jgi:hypothetical protein
VLVVGLRGVSAQPWHQQAEDVCTCAADKQKVFVLLHTTVRSWLTNDDTCSFKLL